MSNVILLFANESQDGGLDPNLRLDEVVIHVMSCSARLEGRLLDLCQHLDAIEEVIAITSAMSRCSAHCGGRRWPVGRP